MSANPNPTIGAIVRKLHAAELVHLREVVADQQALIDAQAAEIEELQRSLSSADGRADMYLDMCNALQDAAPGVGISITQDGTVGLVNQPAESLYEAAREMLTNGPASKLPVVTVTGLLSALRISMVEQTALKVRAVAMALHDLRWARQRSTDVTGRLAWVYKNPNSAQPAGGAA